MVFLYYTLGMVAMIIIGEKINGTLPHVRQAIEDKNDKFIRKLAIDQAEAGADYLDICAGTPEEVEADTLKWLMDIVQQEVDKPLCIDSPNPKVFERVIDFATRPGIINSVSFEKDKCKIIYSLVSGTNWKVIALPCDDEGIPADTPKRVSIAKKLMEKALAYKIRIDDIFIDPLVLSLSTNQDSLLIYLETMSEIKKIYPGIKVTSGLSNISFGMPLRRLINQQFLTITLFEGMDSAIMDPCDRHLIAAIHAVQALKGEDKYCRKFLQAYRQKLLF